MTERVDIAAWALLACKILSENLEQIKTIVFSLQVTCKSIVLKVSRQDALSLCSSQTKDTAPSTLSSVLQPPTLVTIQNLQNVDVAVWQNAAVLIDKPMGWTSFDVCGKLRRVLNMKKVFLRTAWRLETGRNQSPVHTLIFLWTRSAWQPNSENCGVRMLLKEQAFAWKQLLASSARHVSRIHTQKDWYLRSPWSCFPCLHFPQINIKFKSPYLMPWLAFGLLLNFRWGMLAPLIQQQLDCWSSVLVKAAKVWTLLCSKRRNILVRSLLCVSSVHAQGKACKALTRHHDFMFVQDQLCLGALEPVWPFSIIRA